MQISKITGFNQQTKLSNNSKRNICFSRKLRSSDNDVFVRNSLLEDENGVNVFQLGSIEEIQNASKTLSRKETVQGIFATNITGANALHLAMNNPKRIKLLCSYLKSDEIAALALSEDGYKRVPFYDFQGDSFKALLESVSQEDIKKLILSTENKDKTNCLYTFSADKIQTLLNGMNKKDIKELCMQQDIIWNNTPFHRQTKEAIEVLCQALPPEDLADIFTIKNAYGISINEILRN